MQTAGGSGRMVVVRFLDGKIVRGTTHDFAPNKPEFHVYEMGHEERHATLVQVDELKAVFFVKSYEGDKNHDPRPAATASAGQGRKIEVLFSDGETIVGHTMGYNAAKPGFFMVPDDPTGNNLRIYVVNQSVDKVRWL